METVKDKLLKIKALADKGCAGEAINAKLLLDKLLDKYNLTIDDLSGVELKNRRFNVPKNKMFLFYHIVYNVIGKRAEDLFYYGKKTTAQYAKVTDFEYLEISSMANFHFRQLDKELRKQQKTITGAYIYKHSLTVKSEDADDRAVRSDEELLAMLKAIDDLEDIYYRKQIKN